MSNMNCQVCGKGYEPADAEMYATTKNVQLSVLSMDNPGMRKLLGMMTLMRCTNCGRICCADCAKEGGGPTGLACPACGVQFTVNSFLPPTAQTVSSAQPATPQPSEKPLEEKPAKSGGLFAWLRKKR